MESLQRDGGTDELQTTGDQKISLEISADVSLQ